ncbi:putative protein purity of essence [Penaeus vannamei]|uniref:Uncharacterized protein n=1 Tax=Penaeus vannamei TaxID=6689 RepID=A0A423TEV8_PENVA|nr:putative protein purity of essence [Penaeus vannamei]
MAATSGGVEWSQLVKPILAASYGSVNKQDLPELVKSILKSKEEILHHEEQYEPFYASFCVLAADYLASNAHQVLLLSLLHTLSHLFSSPFITPPLPLSPSSPFLSLPPPPFTSPFVSFISFSFPSPSSLYLSLFISSSSS